MNEDEIYLNLGRLIENPPELYARRIDNDAHQWLGRVYALVHSLGMFPEALKLSFLTADLAKEGDADLARQVMSVLYRALAVAELKAPAATRGMFINAGSAFDAMVAVGKVLAAANSQLLIVDPYMDEKVLTDFAVLASEGVSINLLTDSATVKPSLSPAANRWKQQHGTKRPLDVRVSAPKLLHDRTIIVDGTTVWTLTQSFNAFAARSPASIVRIEGDAVGLKISAYDEFWINGLTLP
ncbi:MAG: phosphatidylserine/phosphatidylglycerophosphate/cardiolipin synthase family protein [Mesorhizobium sp.]|uniref:phospholipase D-like domain-containing protein n=1 Tax=Mesorhizobium sp. TaxID=1871066 RepID=UPI000FE96681|nr:phospholipase D-like domain-containing protein [Mesorhizobium sp.]RWP44326.1 MAG: phosphatidylserine/phosphatidylglycerophosphate/cardiolipin synthase family protein [Mesorhizobium sp.]